MHITPSELQRIDNDSNKDARNDSVAYRPMLCCYPFTQQSGDTSVLKPLRGIVGELRNARGNKVFQVVTPAGQGVPGFFTRFPAQLSHYCRVMIKKEMQIDSIAEFYRKNVVYGVSSGELGA